MKNKPTIKFRIQFYRFLLLLIIGFPFPVLSQTTEEFTVTGTVTSGEDQSTLPGVNIIMLGTSTSTITDIDGNYSINVPVNATLIFSFIGFASEEVAVNSRSIINVSLDTDIAALEEVVVVGYGNQDRRDITSSVSTIRSENIRNLPVAGLDQALVGQAAGVQVNQVTGTPGGGVSIRIRGSGSVGAGDDPLYVIDGFPITNNFSQNSNPLTTINPDDIESISILKDASATAIYGSRGANGVILIKTKQAKEGISQVELNAYYGWQSVPQRGRPDMMTAEEFARWRVEHREDLAVFQGNPPPTMDDIPEVYRNPEALGQGTDWFDEMLRIAPVQNYNVTYTSGKENLRTVISGGYFNQLGTVIETGFERYSLRANVEGDIGKRIKIGFNLAPTFSSRKLANTEGHFNTAILTQGLLSSPVPSVRQTDGSFTPNITSPDAFDNANPLNILKNTHDRNKTFRTLANVFLDYQIIDGLTFRSTFNIDWMNTQGSFFMPSNVGTFRSPPPIPAVGRYSNMTLFNWLNENTLTYDKSVGDGHRFNVLVGYSMQKELVETAGISGTEYADDDVKTLNAANLITNGTTGISEWGLVSYLTRLNYVFREKYLFTVTVRADGSSRFGNNNKWGTFPSASFGWRLSEEAFMSAISNISDLKLRGSYGFSGNNSIGNYTYIPQVGVRNYPLGGSLSPGRALLSLANQDLGWEQSEQMDFGIDLGLFGDRIYFMADYYRRTTRDMLINIPIPSGSGFTSAITNIGEILNQGVELAVNSNNIIGSFNWSTDFNIAFNRNKVVALNENNDPIISGGTHITEVGRPMGQFWGYIFEGIYQSEEELQNLPSHQGSDIGTVRYLDTNGDGVITPEDRAPMGDPNPNFIWGITNRFNYKNFDLSIIINGEQGGSILAFHKRFSTNLDGVFNVTRDVMDRWRSPSQPGNGKLPTTVTNAAFARENNSLWVEDASYMYIRNISLGYSPQQLNFIKNVRFYLSVQNALLLTKYSGGNPEINTNGNNSLQPAVDYTGYPTTRTLTVGANLTF